MTTDYAEFDIERAGGSDRYRACTDCNRPMRPKHTLPADHNGYVAHKADGRCAYCYKHRHDDTPDLTTDVLARDVNLATLIFGRRMRGVPPEGWQIA